MVARAAQRGLGAPILTAELCNLQVYEINRVHQAGQSARQQFQTTYPNDDEKPSSAVSRLFKLSDGSEVAPLLLLRVASCR